MHPRHNQQVTERLAEAQETAALRTVYRIYTEMRPNLSELVARYFAGATIIPAQGLYQGKPETAAVIEIVTAADDATGDALQNVVNLAGDIKHANAQASVMLGWSNAFALEV